MKIVIYILFIFSLVFFFAFLIIPYLRDVIRSGRMGKITEGFTCKCGGHIGNSHLTYPFVKITLSASILNVKTSENINYFIPLKQINNLKIKNGIFSAGLAFDFNGEPLVIFTPYCYKLRDFIENNKYKESGNF